MEAVYEIDEDIWASVVKTDGELHSNPEAGGSVEGKYMCDSVEVNAQKLMENGGADCGGEGLSEPTERRVCSH